MVKTKRMAFFAQQLAQLIIKHQCIQDYKLLYCRSRPWTESHCAVDKILIIVRAWPEITDKPIVRDRKRILHTMQGMPFLLYTIFLLSSRNIALCT